MNNKSPQIEKFETSVPYLCLAPIRGLTDCVFRETYAEFFTGFDSSIAPFINPQRHSTFKSKHLRDVLPENNSRMVVIPQLLHTSVEDFIVLCTRLKDLGYNQVNWNLGCPAPMVVHKKRGSGFLPYPDEIISFLESVIPQIEMDLSIKTRLGFRHSDELARLLPRLDQFPLREIIIHARLGKQMYKGKTDIEAFKRCIPLTRHNISYNGDILDLQGFKKLQQQLPDIQSWMIGRGAIADPFLPAIVKGFISENDRNREVLIKFHDTLFNRYQERLSGPSHILGRMKQIWQYLISLFPNSQKQYKQLNKSKKLGAYKDLAYHILDSKTPFF